MLEKDGIAVVEIKDVNSQIGLGPTLFMMTTKAFFYFFILMTIINIPVMMLYYNANTGEMNDARLLSEEFGDDEGHNDISVF